MKKYNYSLLLGLLFSCLFAACSDNDKDDFTIEEVEGLNYSPQTPDADQALTTR